MCQDFTGSWLGISNMVNGTTFDFASDNATVEWTNWNNDEPKNVGKSCANFVSDNAKWNTATCETTSFHFICEKEDSKLLAIIYRIPFGIQAI